MIFPPDRLPKVERHGGASIYQDAPFGHVQIDSNGNATTNLKFREIYGDRPDSLTDLIDKDWATGSYRILLARADGESQFNTVCIVPATDCDPGSRDYLIFPEGNAAVAPGASAPLEDVPVALCSLTLTARFSGITPPRARSWAAIFILVPC
jgi:hypothetical protein